MKKILLSFLLCISAIVPIATTTTPAHATTCDSRRLHAGWNLENFAGDVAYDADGWVFFNHCDAGFDEITSVEYRMERVRGNCLNWGPAEVNYFTLNWGDFGTYNPGYRTFNCPMSGDVVIKFAYPDPAPYTIWHGNSDRCAALYLKIVKNNAPDIDKTSDVQCLS